MEIYQLRTFATVAELGSLARATKRLHISMPAASAHIKALEEEFGVALFERRANGLTLTRCGAALIPQTQRVLTGAADLLAHAADLRGQVTGRLRFGAFFDPGLLRFGELMSRVIALHPMLDIEVHHANSRAIAAGVGNGDLDAGIALGEGELSGIAVVPLRRLRYCIVAPTAWAAAIAGADWKALARLPWISTPRNGSHYRMAEDLFRRHEFSPAKVVEADSEALITNLVVSGVGVGLMREDLALQASAEGHVVVFENGVTSTMLRFIYRHDREEDPAIRALIRIARELWPDHANMARRTEHQSKVTQG